MKKLNLLYALVIVISVVACKDDDDDKGPTFKKEDFYGTWTEDGSQGIVLLKLDANGFYNGTKAGTTIVFSPAIPYTFDGKNVFKMTISGAEFKYIITAKTETTFKADLQAGGQKAGSKAYTKM
jgi:hypothetical protein